MKVAMKKLSLSLLTFLAVTACKSEVTDSVLKGEDNSPFLHQMTFLTSHNAFVNTKDQNIVSVHANQGSLSIEEQLKRGVRGLMVDMYAVNEGFGDEAFFCHGTCLRVPGATDRTKAVDVFKKIRKFLLENRNEIVTIQIEDYLDKAAETSKAETVKDKVTDVFGSIFGKKKETPKPRATDAQKIMERLLNDSGIRDLIFNPYHARVHQNGWPRVGEMIKSNKRLLILSQRRYADHLGVGHDRDFTVENYWSIGGALGTSDYTCKKRWNDIELNRDSDGKFKRLFVMNHFRNIPLQTVQKDGTLQNLRNRYFNDCKGPSNGRRPNFVAIDFAAESGGLEFVKEMNRHKFKGE